MLIGGVIILLDDQLRATYSFLEIALFPRLANYKKTVALSSYKVEYMSQKEAIKEHI